MSALASLSSFVTALAGGLAQDSYTSPDEWGYVVAGWTIIILGVAAYALAVLLKGRQLSKRVAPQDRRWME